MLSGQYRGTTVRKQKAKKGIHRHPQTQAGIGSARVNSQGNKHYE